MRACTGIGPADLFAGRFSGWLAFGKNYWSADPRHNDTAYKDQMAACLNASAMIPEPRRKGVCNTRIAGTWMSEGAKFGMGKGKLMAKGVVSFLGQPDAVVKSLDQVIFDAQDTGDTNPNTNAPYTGKMERFRCVLPKYTEAVSKKTGFSDASTCINMQEGLTIISKYTKMPQTVHPNPEPEKDIPECKAAGDCKFSGTENGPTGKPNFARSGGRFVKLHKAFC